MTLASSRTLRKEVCHAADASRVSSKIAFLLREARRPAYVWPSGLIPCTRGGCREEDEFQDQQQSAKVRPHVDIVACIVAEVITMLELDNRVVIDYRRPLFIRSERLGSQSYLLKGGTDG